MVYITFTAQWSTNVHVASVRPGSQYNTRARVASHCLCIDTHHNVMIDSDPILAFLCVAFLCLIMKLLQNFEYFHVSQNRRNTTQQRHLASHCEPSSRVHSIYNVSQIATSLSHLIYHLYICSSNIISSYSHLHSIPAIEFPLQEDATHTYSTAWGR